jgi:hypothetical protein
LSSFFLISSRTFSSYSFLAWVSKMDLSMLVIF